MASEITTSPILDLANGISRVLPEPFSNLTGSLANLGGNFGDIASRIGTPEISNSIGDPNNMQMFADLLREQVEAQRQMQVINFHSNVEKSKHETRMAPIRNIRAG